MKEQFKNIKPYKLASHKIWSVTESERGNVLKLDWNEATIPTTPKVKEALKVAIEKDVFNYYPETCNQKLIKALANYAQVPKHNIQYFASSDSLHEYIAQMFINDGDKVVILWPSYDNFRVTAEINGANIVYFKYDEEFSFDREAFINCVKTHSPELVYLCNPNNPTGNLHTVDEIEEFVKSFPETIFLIDEAYGEFSGVSCKDLVFKYENIIISRTMSKAFALANFRFGYMISSQKNIENINTIRNAKNVSTLSQVAVLAAFDDLEYIKKYVEEVNKAKKEFVDSLRKLDNLKVYNGHGNFVIIKFQGYAEKQDIIKFLEENNIFVRDLAQDESVRNCIRITIGTRKQMKRVFRVIERYSND